jgi:hypothetical protein
MKKKMTYFKELQIKSSSKDLLKYMSYSGLYVRLDGWFNIFFRYVVLKHMNDE